MVKYDFTIDAKMSNVEIISARIVGGTNASIDFANITGVTTVEIKDTNSDWGNIDGWNVSDAISTYKFTNVARQNDRASIEMRFNNDVFTGTNDAINVVLDKAGNSVKGEWAYLDLYNSDNKSVIEVMNVESKGSDNQFDYSDGWNGTSVLNTVNVTGTAALNLYIRNQDVLATVNAATFNGGLTFNGWSGVDMSVTTGAGKDVIDLSNSSKNNTISTGAGNDTIVGGSGNDTINAGDGDDDITIGAGNDTVNAGAGDDLVRVAGNLGTGDLLDGGDGIDTLAMTSAAAVTASGLTGTASTAYQALFSNFEKLAIGDALAGDIDLAKLDGMQTLVLSKGVTGDRTITGLSSNATVVVKAAAATNTNNTTITVTGASTGTADVLNLTLNAAGSADYGVMSAANVETVNIVSTTSATDPTTVTNTVDLAAAAHTTLNISGNAALNLSGMALTSVKTVAGSAFNAGLVLDLTGNTNATTVTLGNGANTVFGGGGADIINAGDGDNYVDGGAGNDTINAGGGDNNVDGGAGNDTITTGAGNDTITGGDGNDTINAGNGVNTITGGAGLDTMTGGTGVDTYVYLTVGDSQGVTVDVITNFAVGAAGDIIDLSGVVKGTATFAGTASGYGAVLTSLTGGGLNSQAVFDSSTSTLYIDIDGSGTLDSADMAIQLTGVTTGLVAANFDFTLPA